MSDKVITLKNGVPKNTDDLHYSKSEVDALLALKESDSIQGDADTLNAANDYTDDKIAEVMGGVTPETLDTIAEIAQALQNEQSTTGSILTTLSDHETRISNTESDLTSEATARQNADNSLQNNIDNEAAARIAGDASTLSSANAYTDTQIANIPSVTTTSRGLMTSADKVKLDGIQAQATKNSTDAQLRDRATHTGTQLSSTISDFASAVRATVLTGLNNALTGTVLATDSLITALGKLQAQVTRAFDRSNHTGTQTASTISDFNATASAAAPVQSVNGKTGILSIVKSDVGLGNVPNVDATARSTHTGTQIAATISDFAATVRNTILNGLSTSTNAAITASDSVVGALGKLQAQINQVGAILLSNLTPQSTGHQGSAGTANVAARADHKHETVITVFRKVDTTANFQTNSVGYVVVPGMVITPNIPGTYLIDYTCVATSSANNSTFCGAIYKNGNFIEESESKNTGRQHSIDILLGSTMLYMDGINDSIDLRVCVTGASITAGNKRIRMIRVGP